MGSVAWQLQNDEMNRWHSLHACAGGHYAAERGGVVVVVVLLAKRDTENSKYILESLGGPS
jgi:hypothetical protein